MKKMNDERMVERWKNRIRFVDKFLIQLQNGYYRISVNVPAPKESADLYQTAQFPIYCNLLQLRIPSKSLSVTVYAHFVFEG